MNRIISALFLCGTIVCTAQALEPPEFDVSAFRQYKDIDTLSITTPAVVEVPFDDSFMERFQFAIFDNESEVFEPYFFKQSDNIKTLSVTTDPVVRNISALVDGQVDTSTDFVLPDTGMGTAKISLTSDAPVTSSSLTALLDSYVALPTFVEIRAVVGGQNLIVVARKKMEAQTVRFPETTSDSWAITFTYGQPLRINELRLAQEQDKEQSRTLRFLAQPDHTYRIYFDPDRPVTLQLGESANLRSAEDVISVSAETKENSEYVIADVDKDGVPDVHDNCVKESNADQIDENNNGRGDVCDDFDLDGVMNSKDNCPNQPNRNQQDTDGDGVGDVCDDEESRITEKYEWLPWLGMGFAGTVLVALFILMVRSGKHTPEEQIEK